MCIPTTKRNITICVCYHPPDFQQLFGELGQLLGNLESATKVCKVCIIGVFNMPSINCTTVVDTNNFALGDEFCDLIQQNFLSQLVYEHTRISNNGSSSTLDLILTNYPEEINNVEAARGLLNSDHYLVCFNILTRVHRQPKVPSIVHNFKNADFNVLKLALCDIPWETAFLDNDIDVNLRSWEDLFLTCVDQLITKIRIKDPNRPPWIDADVLHLIRKKERVRRKARITNLL
jgi:hypothetical protein